MAKGDDIQERLINFAVQIIELSAKLSKTASGKHISGQILRSGTSPAPNYAEARAAESTKDFIHKLKIVLKELNETNIWLIIIQKSKMSAEKEYMNVLKECDELCKIISSSIKTTIKRNG